MREVLNMGYTKKSKKAGVKKVRGDYLDRLIKFIPAEVVAFYIFLRSLVSHLQSYIEPISWAILVIGILGTVVYLKNATKVKSKLQILISSIAFVIWALAIGGPPLTYLPGDIKDKTVFVSVILATYTFFVPLIAPKFIKESS